jgi:hypothetical protein
MAKRKRTALFEVIQKDKRQSGSPLTVPNWWSKGKAAAPVAPTPVEPPPPTARPIAPPARSIYEILRPYIGDLPLTGTSLAIITAAVVIALSFTFGWIHWGHRAAGGSPNATAALNGPSHPEVMDIPVPRTPDRTTAIPINTTPQQATPAASTLPPTRQPNLSYVCIRLYNSQKSAAATRDLLAQHDIPCTVEHNVPGVQMPLYAVVGLKSFATAGTTDYSDYIAKIKATLVSGGDTKALSPRLIKWTGASSPTG